MDYVVANWKEVRKRVRGTYSLRELSELVGTDVRRSFYRGLAMNMDSFLRLCTLVGEISYEVVSRYARFDFVPSDGLAEFVGIVLGDGGIGDRQVTIALDSKDSGYVWHVVGLVESLFGFRASVKGRRDGSTYVRLNRKGVVELLGSMGLAAGDKIRNGWDVPGWVDSDRYRRACVRGLFDTDGSAYVVSRSGRLGLKFTSKLSGLLDFFEDFCKSTGIYVSRGGTDCQIQSAEGVLKFQEAVGSWKISRLLR